MSPRAVEAPSMKALASMSEIYIAGWLRVEELAQMVHVIAGRKRREAGPRCNLRLHVANFTADCEPREVWLSLEVLSKNISRSLIPSGGVSRSRSLVLHCCALFVPTDVRKACSCVFSRCSPKTPPIGSTRSLAEILATVSECAAKQKKHVN